MGKTIIFIEVVLGVEKYIFLVKEKRHCLLKQTNKQAMILLHRMTEFDVPFCINLYQISRSEPCVASHQQIYVNFAPFDYTQTLIAHPRFYAVIV